jgi:beta-galactosidase/beta-glucuronidase
VQRFSDRIGLRQVTLDGGVLKLNGVAIKLRGIDHHDIWPRRVV